MDPLTIVVELLFAVLFISTLIGYLRRRDSLSRDVMLIFAAVAGLFLITYVGALIGELPSPVVGVALALLLAQPLFTLRLTNQVQTVPRAVRLAALIGYLVTVVPMIVLPIQQVVPLVLGAVLVFVLTDGVAAVYLARAARLRVGSARIRLWAAAAASGSFALALAVATFGRGIPGIGSFAGNAAEVLALAAAFLYALGFMPPGWLRRLWGAVATFEFTEDLLNPDPNEGVDAVWSRLGELARRLTGATASVVVAGEPTQVISVAARDPAQREPLLLAQLVDPLTIVDPRKPVREEDGEVFRLAQLVDARFASVLQFQLAGDVGGALVLLRERPSLFDADDEAILRALIGRGVVFAERTRALAEQAALAQRLSVTVEALEQASQAKSDFLASMSHELRTPLSAIIGFSALMREEPLDNGLRVVPDEWIEHVHRSGDHLLALINDVLDLTKIEAGRIELDFEHFDVATAMAESVEGLRPLADRKSIRMVLDSEAGAINADRGRLRQVVYNLLSNAIKFTPEGGSIEVATSWSGDDAHVSVSDSGVGIAEADHGRVFEEFRQVGDMKAREAGTGLGLALSRRLVEAHGGSISLTSQLGHGSRFEVLLPGSRVRSEPDAQPAQVSGDPAGSTVLVIEDDPGAVRLLRTYLETEGYRVEVATDGESGIQAARRREPDAIILDVLLPGIDGWEVLRRLKADEHLRGVPVVVVTVVDERNIALSLGAADYFLKPIRREALLARMSQYTFTTKVKHGRVRVLAIDDDAAAREVVTNALRPEGFDVVAAASGQEGIDLAFQDPPDLVICDLLMPDMDGYEVVERLHANEATRGVTILILTGQDLSSADRERLNGKVADVLMKGGDPRPAFAQWLRRAAAAAQRRNGVAPTA